MLIVAPARAFGRKDLSRIDKAQRHAVSEKFPGRLPLKGHCDGSINRHVTGQRINCHQSAAVTIDYRIDNHRGKRVSANSILNPSPQQARR